MITTSTLKRVIKFPEISSMDPPRRRMLELEAPNIRMGNITGKPRITIITPALFVFAESADIIVNAEDIPKHPKIILTQNQKYPLPGYPNKIEKRPKLMMQSVTKKQKE
ncbi:MAG: hypothetical protein RIA69_12310 [Cyclobacteriaceae bacterium]